MKKKLKTLCLVLAAFTAGEFITMWRLEPTPCTLKEFTKNYFGSQGVEIERAYNAGGDLLTDRPAAKRELKRLAFPNRKDL